MESSDNLGDSAVLLDAAVASGPRFEDTLAPIGVIRSPSFNDLALTARVAFRYDVTSDTRYGIMLAQTRIPVAGLTFIDAEQKTAGFTFIRVLDRLRLLGEAFCISHRTVQGSGGWSAYWTGLRWYFYRNQALKFQLDCETPLAGKTSHGLQIQLSTLFP